MSWAAPHLDKFIYKLFQRLISDPKYINSVKEYVLQWAENKKKIVIELKCSLKLNAFLTNVFYFAI